MKVLAIGNSFSVDAFSWLHETAKAQGISLVTGNLYIGGCSLERHWNNIGNDTPDYVYYKNGEPTEGFTVAKALADEDWDIVTLQQASHFSGVLASYEPYLRNIARHVRLALPKAKLYIHETWAYETDSTHPRFPTYACDQRTMYLRLKAAYNFAAVEIGAEGFIPCGDAIQIARRSPVFDHAHGGKSLNRDGFHASMNCGRYLLALTWLEALTGADARKNTFVPASDKEPVPTAEELAILRNAAHTAVMEAAK